MRSSSKRFPLWAVSISLFAALAFASTPITRRIPSGKKAKVTGQILSRNADMISVKDKKEGSLVVVNVTDSTTFVRKQGTFKFRHANLDVTAMVPGLTIDAEGVGNAKGQLEASKIAFSPDEFAIEVAEEQQIQANKAAAANAQSTANHGAADAAAQSAANQAQTSADQAQATANAAAAGVVMDAAAISMVNQRVSDLGDYRTVVEAGIYFATGKSALDDAAKADLSKLADLAIQTQGYMIEVAGYASSSRTKQQNEQLSQARAAAVTNYLRDAKNVPMRRMLVPAGYGATHPDAGNKDAQGRALNRRVDVKVIVNKGLNEGM